MLLVVAQALLSVAAQAGVPLLPDAALYRAGSHLYSIAKTDGDALLLLDYDSGRLTRLRMKEDEWIGGPSIGVESPVAVRVRIAGDKLIIHLSSTQITAIRDDAFTTERLGGGTLYVPRNGSSNTAIVMLPGSGNLPIPYFARRGIAVLALDTRADWRSATFETLAADVIAAVEGLRRHNSIDPKHIGIYASSQGGWIAPIAAAESPAIAFIVCAACPATSMPEQELIRTGAELRADGFAARDIENAVAYRKLFFDFLRTGEHRAELEAADEKARGTKWYARFGGIIDRDAPLAAWWRLNDRYVPTEFWRRVHAPALLLFGGLDTRVPPPQHASRISAVDRTAKVVIIPNVDHEGFIAHTGGRDEVPRLDRLPPRAMEPAIDWVLQH